MYNISKQNLWFIIILSVSVSIYYLFNIESTEYVEIYNDNKET